MRMMKTTICCPSYKRPVVETLSRYPRTRVYVAESELGDYIAANPEGSDIVAVPDDVQGNLCRVRNYILDTEFENGTDAVIIIDDDMDMICRHEQVGDFGYERHILDMDELEWFAEHGSMLCLEWGYRFWGVNCVLDPKAYFQQRPFNTTKYIGGPFQAHLNNRIRYDERLPLKEDYDMTLQHLHEWGGVLRFNAYYYICRQAEQTGGCGTYRNVDAEKRQFELLQRKWGSDIIKMDRSSKRGFDFNPIMKSPIKGV